MDPTAFAYFQRGVNLQQKGVYDCAIQEYDRALKIEPDNIDILLNCGAACLQKGWVEKAINLLVRVLEKNQDNTLALYNIGKAFLYSEDYESAVEVFRRLNALTPEDKDVRRLLAASLRQVGKYREAVDINLDILDFLSSDVNALLELAGDLKMLERFENALTVYKKASEVARDSIEPLIGVYKCQLKLGNNEKAIIALKRAMMIEPQNQKLITMLADIYIDEGKIQEAVEILVKAMETIPDAEMLHDKYNEMVRRLPILKKKTNIANYVTTQSNFETEVYNILDSLYDGKIQLDAAIGELEVLRSREPGDLLVADELANLFFQSRQYDKASEIYSALLLSYPKEPKHRIDLAKSLSMKGDIEAARETLTSSIKELGPIAEFELALT